MRRLILISLLALALLLFGCTEQPEGNKSNYTVLGAGNQTPLNLTANTTPATPKTLPDDYSVNLGDTVWVNYTLWVDGKVYDTNNATLAQEAGIYNMYRSYEPFKFEVAFNKGTIEGFVINVIGMRLNETVRFKVDPARGYGPYDPSKVMVIPRYYNKSMYEDVPRSYLEDRGIDITNGSGFSTDAGTVFINDYNDENVTLFYLLSPGHNFTINGIPQQVNYTSNMTATIEYMFQVNRTYAITDPDLGTRTLYRVTDKNETDITLDYNHPLANETLEFQVTLLDAVQGS